MLQQRGGMRGGDPESVGPREQGCSAGAGCGLGKLGRSRILGDRKLGGGGALSLLPSPFNFQRLGIRFTQVPPATAAEGW